MTIRAVYEKGILRPLDKVELSEGDLVKLNIEGMSQDEKLHAVLADVVTFPQPYKSEDEAASASAELDQLIQQLTEEVGEGRSLSQTIIEERLADE